MNGRGSLMHDMSTCSTNSVALVKSKDIPAFLQLSFKNLHSSSSGYTTGTSRPTSKPAAHLTIARGIITESSFTMYGTTVLLICTQPPSTFALLLLLQSLVHFSFTSS